MSLNRLWRLSGFEMLPCNLCIWSFMLMMPLASKLMALWSVKLSGDSGIGMYSDSLAFELA